MALGQLNLHPWEFLRYTPGELKDKIKGFQELKKAEKRNLAWAVANLMNSTGNYKKEITPSALLGEKTKTQEKTGEQLRKEHEELKKRFAERRKKNGKG